MEVIFGARMPRGQQKLQDPVDLRQLTSKVLTSNCRVLSHEFRHQKSQVLTLDSGLWPGCPGFGVEVVGFRWRQVRPVVNQASPLTGRTPSARRLGLGFAGRRRFTQHCGGTNERDDRRREIADERAGGPQARKRTRQQTSKKSGIDDSSRREREREEATASADAGWGEEQTLNAHVGGCWRCLESPSGANKLTEHACPEFAVPADCQILVSFAVPGMILR